MGRRKIPEHKDLVDCDHAVAGHAGTLCDVDGTLFIKPCTKQEVDFYDDARTRHPAFYQWMPTHLGALTLTAETQKADIDAQVPEAAVLMSEHLKEEMVELAHRRHPSEPVPAAPVSEIATPWAPGRNRKLTTDLSIVLENSAAHFVRPNIMDCKLGVRLWADDAPPEKKKRFDRISAETTHKTHGFRISGMRTFQGYKDNKGEDKRTDPDGGAASEREDKAEDKSASDSSDTELDQEAVAVPDPDEYKKYDKDWGRLSVTPQNIVESMLQFVYNPAAGVAAEDAELVCDLFLADLIEIEKMLSNEETRMYSASLLFVVEGDGQALSLAIREEAKAAAAQAAAEQAEHAGHARARKAAKTSADSSPGWSNNRVDSGIDMSEDEVREKQATSGAGDLVQVLTLDGGIESEDDEDDKASTERKIYSLRLIDFAHAEWVPGQGPDENVLFGVRSLVSVFKDMCKRLATGDPFAEPAAPAESSA